MEEYIFNIYKYNNLNHILLNFSDNDFIFINKLFLINNIVNKIYLSNKKQILFLLNKAKNIIKNYKLSKISELYESASNLMNIFLNIKETKQINILLFNNLLENFEITYNKFYDTKYKNLLLKFKELSLTIQIILLNKNNKKIEFNKELIKQFNIIYKSNDFLTIQFITRKLRYLYFCDVEIYNISWELIKLYYKNNPCNTFYILLLELRKLLLEYITNPLIKKDLYYKIDIDVIKYDIQCNKKNKFNLLKSINLLRTKFNIHNNDDNDVILHDFKLMFSNIFENNKIVNKINVTQN